MLYVMILVLFGFFHSQSFAQPAVFVGDTQLDAAVDRHIVLQQEKGTLTVHRIQLLVTSDRRQLEREMRSFGRLYPNFYTSWHYKMPYYHLKTGIFLSKLEAAKHLQDIKAEGFHSLLLIEEEMSKDEFERHFSWW
jgi:hypothetical protein